MQGVAGLSDTADFDHADAYGYATVDACRSTVATCSPTWLPTSNLGVIVLFQVTITRYEGVADDPDRSVAWQTVDTELDQFQSLELIRKETRGFPGECTRFTILDEDDTPIDETDLIALAYVTAHRNPMYRARFAYWVVDALEDILYPWDDLVRLSPPPPTYWLLASWWLRRMLGDVEDWLADRIDAVYKVQLRSELARYDTRAAKAEVDHISTSDTWAQQQRDLTSMSDQGLTPKSQPAIRRLLTRLKLLIPRR